MVQYLHLRILKFPLKQGVENEHESTRMTNEIRDGSHSNRDSKWIYATQKQPTFQLKESTSNSAVRAMGFQGPETATHKHRRGGA